MGIRKLTALFLALSLGIVALTSNVSAVAPNPSYGKAAVDGNYTEWDLTNDYFADMYRAFDPTKPVESKLYLRYDCAKNVMYVLVLTVSGVPALQEPQNAWVSIDGVSNKVLTGNDINDGVPPDFAWVYNNTGTLVGYEASFGMNEGSYKIVAHVEVYDAGGAQTSGSDRKTDSAGVDLIIDCPDFTPDPSIYLEKYVSVDGGDSWWPADTSPGPTALEGYPVYFKFLVTNTGNVDLSPIELTDSLLQDMIGDCNLNKLVPGESSECEIGPVTAALREGETNSTYMNTATVSGKYKDAFYSHEDVAYYIVGQPAIIGNQVWQDMNGDGFQNADEPGIEGVTVELRKCSDDTLVSTTVTTEHGRYRFDVDPAYSYYLVFVPPTGYVITLQDQGTNDAFDSDADPVTGKTECITVEYGEEDLTWDAGLYIPPMLGGDVWDDYNADGIHEISEPGISGITVELYTCIDNSLVSTTVTDNEGYYEFINLVPGQCYYINFPEISGYVSTLQDQDTDEYADSDANRVTGNTISIYLVSGQNDHSWNGGYVYIQPGTGTPGYWKTHPEAWPVETITIGGVEYTKAQAIAIMNSGTTTDVSYTAFRALVAAKLNVAIGDRSFCVDETITSADAWMVKYKVSFTVTGTTVKSNTPLKASSTAWKEGEPLFTKLDNYNNGYLCAPSRNFFEMAP